MRCGDKLSNNEGMLTCKKCRDNYNKTRKTNINKRSKA